MTQILNEPIKGKAYMWSSHQPFVLPVKILNFEEQTEPNISKIVQSKCNLLDSILGTITEFNEKEEKIFKKFIDLLSEKGTDINNRELIFSDPIKGELSKALYKKLTDFEKDFLESEDGIAYYDDKPFALKYQYFEIFYEKARIYHMNTDNK